MLVVWAEAAQVATAMPPLRMALLPMAPLPSSLALERDWRSLSVAAPALLVVPTRYLCASTTASRGASAHHTSLTGMNRADAASERSPVRPPVLPIKSPPHPRVLSPLRCLPRRPVQLPRRRRVWTVSRTTASRTLIAAATALAARRAMLAVCGRIVGAVRAVIMFVKLPSPPLYPAAPPRPLPLPNVLVAWFSTTVVALVCLLVRTLHPLLHSAGSAWLGASVRLKRPCGMV